MQIQKWLGNGALKLGTILSIDHPVTVEIAKSAGFDWLWIDAEHGRFDAASAATACAIVGEHVPTFIRVPDRSETSIQRYLDAGANGIIVPQISSLDDARSVAKAALYPPAGQRSVGIARAQGYGSRLAAYLQERSYAILLQIETLAGVAAIQDIVREPYVDAILVGPYDLSGSCGVPGDIGCEQVLAAIAAVLAACKRVGKPCGIFAGTAEAGSAYAAQGFDLIAVGVDAVVLGNAYQALRQSMAGAGTTSQ